MDPERAGRVQELGFRIGIGLKGLDGLVELTAGLLLWFAPGVLSALADAVATTPDNDSATDRFIERWAGNLGASIASGSHVTVIVFLISHGIVKLALVYCLLRDYRWIYRPALVILGLFAVYQLVVLIEAPSPAKAVLLLLDVVIIWLVWREWRSRTARGVGARPG